MASREGGVGSNVTAVRISFCKFVRSFRLYVVSGLFQVRYGFLRSDFNLNCDCSYGDSRASS